DRVLHVKLELRTVERAFSRRDLVVKLLLDQRVGERLLGGVPLRLGPHALLGPRGELDGDVGETERRINLVEQLDEALDLGLDRLGRAEDVRVVLAEAPYAVEPVDHATSLVTMQTSKIGDAPGELAITAPPRSVDEAVARAVHRLDAERLVETF